MTVSIKLAPGILKPYSAKTQTLVQRRRTLRSKVRKLGWLPVFRRLNVLWVFNRKRNPTLAKRFLADRNYVRRTLKAKKSKGRKGTKTKKTTTKTKRRKAITAKEKEAYFRKQIRAGKEIWAVGITASGRRWRLTAADIRKFKKMRGD